MRKNNFLTQKVAGLNARDGASTRALLAPAAVLSAGLLYLLGH
jgi:hypothetical protein